MNQGRSKRQTDSNDLIATVAVGGFILTIITIAITNLIQHVCG